MTELSKFSELIHQTIDKTDFGKEPPELYDPIYYIMSKGGKRLRPMLALISYSLYKEDIEQALNPAVAIEVFHNFTLMHDDIMDNAPIRRGRATVHEKWNDNVAILSGDVMLVKAYDLLLSVPKDTIHQVIFSFNQCAAGVCEGQQLDMNYEHKDHISEDLYLEMIRKKTAVLIGFSLELGAMLAQAPEKEQHILREFGELIGLGFQLKDDWLDVYAEGEKFGKQIGGDILANKKTYLLIKALELANEQQHSSLMKWLQMKAFDPREKIHAVKSIYDQLGINQITQKKMNEIFHNAFDILKGLSVEKAKMDLLTTFSHKLINRDK